MPREYKKLMDFQYADELAIGVYSATSKFPKSEIFGLTSQMRRAAVSVPANIVEGCYRESLKEYIQFLNISLSSLAEMSYYLDLSNKLGYLNETDFYNLTQDYNRCIRTLNALIQSLKAQSSPKSNTKDRESKPENQIHKSFPKAQGQKSKAKGPLTEEAN